MEKPDVELELERDDKGFVTKAAFKVHNREPEGKPVLEFLEALALVFYEPEPTLNIQADITHTKAK